MALIQLWLFLCCLNQLNVCILTSLMSSCIIRRRKDLRKLTQDLYSIYTLSSAVPLGYVTWKTSHIKGTDG
ncbi:UNVERIFIED_CONTAM: hypothetical protein FKN15_030208 [Acipenser sinensis]